MPRSAPSPRLVPTRQVPSPVSSPAETDATLDRARSGDTDAFGALYQQHAGRVYALCLRLSGDRARARELTHDAFVRAWDRLGSFRGDSSFGTWLHRLTVNVVLEADRRDRRREARVSSVDDAGPEFATAIDLAAADPGARIDLERAIAQLPPGARQVFVLHDVEGYRHDEIATRMSIAPGTVRAHLHRARKQLIAWLNR